MEGENVKCPRKKIEGNELSVGDEKFHCKWSGKGDYGVGFVSIKFFQCFVHR